MRASSVSTKLIDLRSEQFISFVFSSGYHIKTSIKYFEA